MAPQGNNQLGKNCPLQGPRKLTLLSHILQTDRTDVCAGRPRDVQQPSEHGTYKTFKARLWPYKDLQPCLVVPASLGSGNPEPLVWFEQIEQMFARDDHAMFITVIFSPEDTEH